MNEEDERALAFKELIRLNEDSGEISLTQLHQFLLCPFPEGYPDLRFYNWQLSLKVLPLKRQNWGKTWEKRESQYYRLVDRMFRGCPEFLEYGLRGGQIIESADVMAKIHGDVIRIQRSLPAIFQIVNNPQENHIHLHRLERLIYVFSLVNSHCPYTQGFHELASVLYYVALSGSRALAMTDDRAEAIGFFLFFNLIIGTKLYTLFANVENLTNMQQLFQTLEEAVKLQDANFAHFLFQEMSIQPLCFSVSWVSLLFSQMLDIPVLLLLWDHLLVFYDRIVEFVMMVSAGFILVRKNRLSQMNYEDIMFELQNNNKMNIMSVLRVARSLWDTFYGQT